MQVINERIIDRAVKIWKDWLAHPRYDNGDSSPAGFMAMAITMQLPSNASAERLEAFGVALKGLLMTPDQNGCYSTFLGTDYGPCQTLTKAAEIAELKMEFPWKTTMHVHDDVLVVRAGYSRASLYHYPLPDGRWLVTQLSGGDMPKVIDYVMGGKPEFQVEEA